MEVHIQRLTPSQLPDLLRLAQQLEDHSINLEDLEQAYSHQQAELAYLGYLAYDKQDQPVAFCGAIAQQLEGQDAPIMAAQFTNLLVSSEWQDSRLLKRLARRVEILCLSYSIALHYATVSEEQQAWLMQHMDWQKILPSEAEPEQALVGRSFDPAVTSEQFQLSLTNLSL